MTRREFLRTSAMLGSAVAMSGCADTGAAGPATRSANTVPSKPSKQPNIVVILADDMGFSDIGCYGSEIHTPNIDRLAKNGVRFSQMYNCARCCPTRASLLTGLYPHQAGIGYMIKDMHQRNYEGYLNDRCLTIAEALGANGYKTYLSGKWHVGTAPEHWPCKRGFDECFSLIGGAANYWGRDQKKLYVRNDKPIHIDPNGFYLTDVITDHAIDFMGQKRPPSQPYFLYLAYTAPHWPLHAYEQDIAKYRGLYRDGWEKLRERRYQRMVDLGVIDRSWNLPPWPADAESWPGAKGEDEMDLRMAVYAAQIDRMDQGIGRVLSKIRQMGEEDNTLILFLSDNGGCAEVRELSAPGAVTGTPDSFVSYGQCWATASNTPFRKYKRWVHEGGISAPMIGYWPGTITAAGTLSHERAHVMDIMPTCLDAAGVTYPRDYNGRAITPSEGRSFLPVLRGKTILPRDTIYWEHEGHSAVRDGDWKLVCDQERNWELYNMRTDRTETQNLADTDPGRVARLAADYDRWANRCGVVPFADMLAKVNAKPSND